MKTIIISLFTVIFSITSIFSQESCSVFYPFTAGTSAEVTTKNKRGKTVAVLTYNVLDVTNNSGTTQAKMNAVMKDKNDKILTESTYNISCTNTGVSIDYQSMTVQSSFTQFDDIESDITGTNIVIPNDLAVGTNLPDANIDVKMNMSGIRMNMYAGMLDREVTGKESITTPAGTFDCFVIEYTSQLRMGMTQTGKAKQWIAKGVGMVKQEDYNSRGDITSSSLLTAFNQ